MTKFEKKVYEIVKKIPRGKTLTYKQIAVKLGNAGLARAIGNALAKNRDHRIVPCHRVIKSNGEVGGWAWGSEKKKVILIKEGYLDLRRRK
jgi:O-6-methylguanine DNA methyltransferase